MRDGTSAFTVDGIDSGILAQYKQENGDFRLVHRVNRQGFSLGRTVLVRLR